MLRRSVVALGGHSNRVWPKDVPPENYSSERLAEIHMASERRGDGFMQVRKQMQGRLDRGGMWPKLKGRTFFFTPDPHNFHSAEKLHENEAEANQAAHTGYPYPGVFFFAFFVWYWWVTMQSYTGPRAEYVVPDPHHNHRYIKQTLSAVKDEGNEPLVKLGWCEIRPDMDRHTDYVIPQAVSVGH
eukprot:TRINITY_DN9565_c0_g1_i1.p1 TRINITY_DN9565_c0_g1~~TRINITY_DN9565_c0_g1_i1.p1  ORF type:complete len:185 (+),score=59.33 TRINITY_DN9565_c0_g1_i1:47-601(+)